VLTNNSTLYIIEKKDKNPMTSFGSMLREKRRLAGISQRELAKEIGVDFSYISKMENDRLPPPAAETIIAITRVLDIPSEELLSVAGKIPSDVQKAIGESQAAQEFLRNAQQLSLTDTEWKSLSQSLYSLRNSDIEDKA
jgi:transcriptional regulator with XRE-family HTH domain